VLKKNRIIYIIAAVVAVVAVVVLVITLKQGNSGGLDLSGSDTLKVEVKPNDMAEGSPKAPVLMVEYASMTCPHCARMSNDVMPKVKKDYIDTGKLRYVFREYSLDGAARLASAVARCLPEDNYFSFIDLLFRNQDKWAKDADGDGTITKEDIIAGLVAQGKFAGMSQEKVKSCADDKKNLDVVDANYQEGNSKYGVDSTPTFIIGGQVHKGEMTYEQFQEIIKPLLAK
jgi:protein-disulfide isomerase